MQTNNQGKKDKNNFSQDNFLNNDQIDIIKKFL